MFKNQIYINLLLGKPRRQKGPQKETVAGLPDHCRSRSGSDPGYRGCGLRYEAQQEDGRGRPDHGGCDHGTGDRAGEESDGGRY